MVGLAMTTTYRNDPSQRSTSGRERIIVKPAADDDESPRSRFVAFSTIGRIQSEEDGGDDETDAVGNHSDDQWPATTDSINEHHAGELSEQCEDGRNALVLERVVTGDTNLGEDLN